MGQECKVLNPTAREYRDECVRLAVEPPAGAFAVECDGKRVVHQVEVLPSGRRAIWVCVDMPPQSEKAFRIVEGKAPPEAKPKVGFVTTSGPVARLAMNNGLLYIEVPTSAGAGAVPCPISSVALPGGKPMGAGQWNTARKLTKLTATVVGDGTLFGKVRLRYEFDGKAGLNGDVPAFAEIDVSLAPGRRHAVIEERHEMDMRDCWEFDAAAGWKPQHAICRPHGSGFGRPDLGPWPPDTLKTGQTRMGDTLLNLLPRWSQAYDDGWFFVAHDGKTAVGALAARAGKWFWPHDNMIAVKVKDSADAAVLQCPTWKGRRCWFLVAGPLDNWGPKADNPKKQAVDDYVTRHAFEPLDKLNNDYDLDWPGKEGKFRGFFCFSDAINPTGMWRGMGRNALANAGKRAGDYGAWTHVQVLLDPDAYGSSWLFWSPENPNFYTDYIKVPIGEGTNLKSHPNFKLIARLAEMRLREDVYHSVTLPGGAGNECPGYSRAFGAWYAMAPICKEHYGFDPTTWPRLKAAASFQAHVSPPDGPGNRTYHPAGDTHPGKFDAVAFAARFGYDARPGTWKTEELPGFGVIFRNRCSTADETFLSFKSGPNRGHYHGDQLSFHLCFGARPVAVDHHCSYKPRAGQEHMHNRVAFSSDEYPYANMDGYERVIALRTGEAADVAVGQVESPRIRKVNPLPPEDWDSELPQKRFDKPLVYRRTVVLLKGAAAGADSVVIRDQYAGPALRATYCLHVLGDKCERKGDRVLFDDLTLTVAAPKKFAFDNLPWSHNNGGPESTQGARLSVKGDSAEFVTVIQPGGAKAAVTAIPGGVKVGTDEITFAGGIDDDDATTYVTVKRGGKVAAELTGKDIDMDRSQGEVGLFVPDAGYPFGPVPNWLIRQRSKVPDWAKSYVQWLRQR